MLFEIIETGKQYEITLRAWEYEQLSPDVFYDFETNVPRTCEKAEGSDAYRISRKSFFEVLEYWESECSDFNAGKWSEQFGELADIGHDRKMLLRSRRLS